MGFWAWLSSTPVGFNLYRAHEFVVRFHSIGS